MREIAHRITLEACIYSITCDLFDLLIQLKISQKRAESDRKKLKKAVKVFLVTIVGVLQRAGNRS